MQPEKDVSASKVSRARHSAVAPESRGLALFGRDEFCTMPSNGERNVRNSEALRLVGANPPTFLFSYCLKFPPTMVGAVEGKYPERKAAGFGHNPETALVRTIMVKKNVILIQNQSLDEAQEFKSEQRRRSQKRVSGAPTSQRGWRAC